MDQVLAAKGQTVRGADGSSLKVLQAVREDDGQLRLRVEFEDLSREGLIAVGRIIAAGNRGGRRFWNGARRFAW